MSSSAIPKLDAESVTPRLAGKQRVVRGLLTGLLAGHWQGGDRLTEGEAAERFGVSRTPVREALLELRGLGLIELHRNRGAVFLPFGSGELRQIYAVRSLLEVEAARLAATRLDSARLDALAAGFRRIRDNGGLDADWRHDREFHAAIADGSGNPRLAAEIGRYGDLVQATREIVGSQALGIHASTAVEHLRVVRAMRKGEPEAAAEAMRRHLEQAATSAASAVGKLRTASTAPVA